MCGIAGHFILEGKRPSKETAEKIFSSLYEIMQNTSERGRDSYGIVAHSFDGVVLQSRYVGPFVMPKDMFMGAMENAPMCSIINFRGEPSTEIVTPSEYSIQPLTIDGFSVAHNGTISNDKEILNSGNVVKNYLSSMGYDGHIIDSYAILETMIGKNFEATLQTLQGSFALAILTPDSRLILARNYRDLAVHVEDYGDCSVLFFSSKPQYLPFMNEPHLPAMESIPPYSYMFVSRTTKKHFLEYGTFGHVSSDNTKKAIVVLSGGLDSTTVAMQACLENEEIELLHVLYGCKAEDAEKRAVTNIHAYLQGHFPDKKITLRFFETDLFKKLGGSTITDESLYDQIAEGDKGVETHNEWVPARNLVFISVAASICDRFNVGNIYLGLNMEEGSAYPDNTTEFYERLTTVLNCGTTSRAVIKNPLANMMKHEIVAFAKKINAPIFLSWSCYHGGTVPCGKCGPCTMRKKSFERHGVTHP